MLIHLKGKWPEQNVPDGEPLWLFYEVVEERDVVTRTVEIFPGGLSSEREGQDARHPQNRSLVHGAFLKEERCWLEVISEAEFNRQWDTTTDNPFP